MTDSPLAHLSRSTLLPAAAFTVETGAMMGDPIGTAEDSVAGDLYVLDRRAEEVELVLTRTASGSEVAIGSSLGTPGTPVIPIARHQVMGERGASAELLVLDIDGQHYLLALGPLSPADEYTLISSEAAGQELASVSSVSFTRGTHVTLSDGRQCAVETLKIGDRVLTRDHGPQPIRWIGRQTVRAEGANAPVVLAEGAMGNARTLILSPDHRLFVYQRQDTLGTGERELLVRARHLVNGETIWRDTGGHVDYFHLLFDAHEIIYVEGIPAESLLVSDDVMAGLDDEMTAEIQRRLGGRAQRPRRGLEPAAADLQGTDAAALLRRATSG